MVLADDESEFRRWLRSLLEGSETFQVVGEAESGIEALDLVIRLNPDVVITDLDMPGGDGLELARGLRVNSPDVKVITVSGQTEKGYERLAKEEGALAFIPKSASSHVIVRFPCGWPFRWRAFS